MRALIPVLALAASLPTLSQEAPRFAVFSLEQLLTVSKRAQVVFAPLRAKGSELNERLKTRADELQKLDQQLKSGSLSEEGRARLQREFQDGETAYKRMAEDSDKEIRAVQQSVFSTFEKEVGPLVQELAKEQKLNVVFQYNAQTQALFAFTDETWAVGFTNEVAKRYDARFPSGDAPAKEAPKAAPARPAAAKPAPKPEKK